MSEVFALEKQLEDGKLHVERKDLALKLYNNREFKKLILEEFCVNECARYAQMSADPTLSPVDQANALAIAQSAGHLRRFLSVMVQMGTYAENNRESIEQAIAEARVEEQGADD